MLHYEGGEWTIATAVVVREGVQPINSAAVLLQPLWTRSTHVMTFGAVTLDWLDHWRSPSTINCTEGRQPEIPTGYQHQSRRLPGCRTGRTGARDHGISAHLAWTDNFVVFRSCRFSAER